MRTLRSRSTKSTERFAVQVFLQKKYDFLLSAPASDFYA
jgi:hypothetical protein